MKEQIDALVKCLDRQGLGRMNDGDVVHKPKPTRSDAPAASVHPMRLVPTLAQLLIRLSKVTGTDIENPGGLTPLRPYLSPRRLSWYSTTQNLLS